MITIREIKPIKVSGRSSFLVQLDHFDTDVADAIRALPTSYYHKTISAWEIAVNCLAQLLDSLTFIDDIKLILNSELENTEDNSAELTEEEIRSFKIKPFAHQIDAINFGLRQKHKKWLLLDSMGLG